MNFIPVIFILTLAVIVLTCVKKFINYKPDTDKKYTVVCYAQHVSPEDVIAIQHFDDRKSAVDSMQDDAAKAAHHFNETYNGNEGLISNFQPNFCEFHTADNSYKMFWYLLDYVPSSAIMSGNVTIG